MRPILMCAVLTVVLVLGGCGSGDVEVQTPDDPKATAAHLGRGAVRR